MRENEISLSGGAAHLRILEGALLDTLDSGPHR